MSDLDPQVQPRHVGPNYGTDDPDPRLGCWFCATPSVALAPRHTGGDLDLPSHWLPVCQDHLAVWFEEVPEDERLPVIPRFGVVLLRPQAEAVRDTLKYGMDNGKWRDDDADDAELIDAYDALEVGLANLPAQRHD